MFRSSRAVGLPVFGSSHVWKVVQAVLVGGAAIVAIVGWLTNMVGLVYAVVAIVVLLGLAIVIGVVTRPKKQPQPPASIPEQPEAKPVPVAKKQEEARPTPPAKPRPEVRPTDALMTGIRIGQEVRQDVLRAARTLPTNPSRDQSRSFKEEPIRRHCEVMAGRVTTVKLPVVKGDYIYGRLLEKDGMDFTWAIVDPKGLGLMERGSRFFAQKFETDVPSATVDWTVPSDGPWFLAFDATGKQYIRDVDIELWRRTM